MGKVGHPRKFESAEEMVTAIEAYFLKCDARVKEVVTGPPTNRQIKKVRIPTPYTIQGLAVALDLTTDGLLKYSNRDEFVSTVKRAKATVEANKVVHMLDGDGFGAGYIFDLKHNHGWTDKSQVEQTGKDGGPIEHRIITALRDRLANQRREAGSTSESEEGSESS